MSSSTIVAGGEEVAWLPGPWFTEPRRLVSCPMAVADSGEVAWLLGSCFTERWCLAWSENVLMRGYRSSYLCAGARRFGGGAMAECVSEDYEVWTGVWRGVYFSIEGNLWNEGSVGRLTALVWWRYDHQKEERFGAVRQEH